MGYGILRPPLMGPQHYQKLLKEWKIDDESTKEKLENLEGMPDLKNE